ncbi:erythromycin esterase family protein [Labedaea rhizosphaerae]|uniref:Erythromycin esterase n=1 Tax=Labedaea rhizosphaerae TaxID=598644 RepID=A0A4R6S9X9_LABRH|nr:erythromycin esterase family protein [Labedaea rhizosphaerae]TDP96283.1 erythromycin esterase [Labedaea rhizosphaerae]
MSHDIRAFLPADCDLLGIGEPTHQEPGFGRIRNELFAQLTELGFRSVAMETDRVAALVVDEFVRDGVGTLDTVMSEGFSHEFGALEPNRELVSWMHEYNMDRPPADRLAFHGFDAAMETMSAPSPRAYLEHARDYLGLDLDIASLAGDDEQWSRVEAVMDPAMSPGATAEADQLRVLADDLLLALYTRAPELIAITSRARWLAAKAHLTAGLGLLRYHKQCAQPLELNARIAKLSNCRDALMAQNLLELRQLESGRGPTLVSAHNSHLQRSPSAWRDDNIDFGWLGAGATIGALLGQRYTVVAGSLGCSAAIGLAEPPPHTYEASLQDRVTDWALIPTDEVAPAEKRTDTNPRQGYFPLDKTILDGIDVVLHLRG